MRIHLTAPARGGARRVRGITAMLLLSTVLAGPILVMPAAAQDVDNAPQSYSIPAQSLSSALIQFSKASGLQVFVDDRVAAGVRSKAVQGSLPAEAALAKLLAGSGLITKVVGNNTIAVIEPGSLDPAFVAESGSLLLDAIVVSGGKAAGKIETYETPAPKAYIAQEDIERYRGSNASDIFRGVNGVMSGDSRNSGSAIDVNIRGMQGMERVAVTIDGAMNSTTLYQGYQGISNRSYIDPDFIAGVDITKGSDASSRGIAGSVAVTTIEARDIVKPGNNWGFRLKLEAGNNTATPNAGAKSGYEVDNNATLVREGINRGTRADYIVATNAFYAMIGIPIVITEAPDLAYPYYYDGEQLEEIPVEESYVYSDDSTMNRPNFTDLTQASGSAVVAYQDESFEFLAAVARRVRGNYFAGENGDGSSSVENLGTQPYCADPASAGCFLPLAYYDDYYVRSGDVNYRLGEQVLNTQLETTSVLLKGTYKFGDGHAIQLGYNGFKSEAGDRLASALTSSSSRAVQQEQTVGTDLKTVTLKYRWKPLDNELIDLKANVWGTDLKRRNPRRANQGNAAVSPTVYGLPEEFRVGTDNTMHGFDVSNRSSLTTNIGPLDLDYGFSYLHQDTKPSAYTSILEGWLDFRDGERDEYAAFAKADLEVNDWLNVNAGLRFQKFTSLDRSPSTDSGSIHGQSLSDSGWSPSVGVVVAPWQDTQFYAKYSSALRLPSMFETLTGFSTAFNPDLVGERSNNWEVGTNITRTNLFTEGDTTMVKFGYFNWNVDNYLAREWNTSGPSSTMLVYNIDKAKFQGLELNARYENGGFAADFAANYYLDVAFCVTSDTCESTSLYADYSTNQIPPEYTVSLALSQKLLNEDLTVGGRVELVGARAVGHGQITQQGASPFISLIDWDPYTLVDVFAEYKITDNITANFRIENLTDQYYIDPLSLVVQPGPGRTAYIGVTASF